MASEQRTVSRDQHDGNVVGEAQVGVGGGFICVTFVCVNTVQRVISPCWYGDVLIEFGQSVCQVYVVEIPRNHVKLLRVLVLERADVVMKLC